MPGNEVVNCALQMKKTIDTTFDKTIWAGSDFDRRIVLQRIVVDTEMEMSAWRVSFLPLPRGVLHWVYSLILRLVGGF